MEVGVKTSQGPKSFLWISKLLIFLADPGFSESKIFSGQGAESAASQQKVEGGRDVQRRGRGVGAARARRGRGAGADGVPMPPGAATIKEYQYTRHQSWITRHAVGQRPGEFFDFGLLSAF